MKTGCLLLVLIIAQTLHVHSEEAKEEDIPEDEFMAEFNKLNLKLDDEAGFMMLRSSPEEKKLRYSIFKERYPEIKRINENENWAATTNKFTIMTDSELGSYRGLNISLRSKSEGVPVVAALRDSVTVPESKNWVKEGKVTGIKAQLDCGSCWAFAAVSALESHYAIKTGKLRMMSEQQVLDCTYADIRHDGCKGGWMSTAYKKIVEKLRNRLPTGQAYQYKAFAGDCVSKRSNALLEAKINPVDIFGVGYYRENEEIAAPYGKQLTTLVGTVGPVAVAMEVVNSMYSYASGVYSEDKGCRNQVNHAVVVVGYDKDTFLIRNSWGSGWGDEGYITFDRTIKNQCFISSYQEYPLLVPTGKKEKAKKSTPCNPQPCMNKGRCKSNKEKTDYICTCSAGFKGKNCQEKAVTCENTLKNKNRCPKSKTHWKCKKSFFINRCPVSCGKCYQ